MAPSAATIPAAVPLFAMSTGSTYGFLYYIVDTYLHMQASHPVVLVKDDKGALVDGARVKGKVVEESNIYFKEPYEAVRGDVPGICVFGDYYLPSGKWISSASAPGYVENTTSPRLCTPSQAYHSRDLSTS